MVMAVTASLVQTIVRSCSLTVVGDRQLLIVEPPCAPGIALPRRFHAKSPPPAVGVCMNTVSNVRQGSFPYK